MHNVCFARPGLQLEGSLVTDTNEPWGSRPSLTQAMASPGALQILSPRTARQSGPGDPLVPATCLSPRTRGLGTPVPALAPPIPPRFEPKLQLWPGRGVEVQVGIQLLLQRLHIFPQSYQAGCGKWLPGLVIGCFLAAMAQPHHVQTVQTVAKCTSISEKTEVMDSPPCLLTLPSSPSSCKLESQLPCPVGEVCVGGWVGGSRGMSESAWPRFQSQDHPLPAVRLWATSLPCPTSVWHL